MPEEKGNVPPLDRRPDQGKYYRKEYVTKGNPTHYAGEATLPEICRFLGIVVYILYDDHPPPHFHAEYGEYKITVEINTGVVQGRFPRRALSALMEWYDLHREELLADWLLAEQHRPLQKILPLE